MKNAIIFSKATRRIFYMMGMLSLSVILFTGCSGSDKTASDSTSTVDSEKTVETADATTSTDTPDETTSDTSSTATTTTDSAATEERSPAPAFTLPNSEGGETSLSDFKGKLVILNFFTTWCKYCKEEFPMMAKVYQDIDHDKVEIILVNVTTDSGEVSKEEVIAWYKEQNLPFPMVLDVEGDAIANYPLQGYPTSFFIDQDGNAIAYLSGAMDEATLRQVITEYQK